MATLLDQKHQQVYVVDTKTFQKMPNKKMKKNERRSSTAICFESVDKKQEE